MGRKLLSRTRRQQHVMEWEPDVSVGAWIADSMTDKPFATVSARVPDCFDAHAKVFFSSEIPESDQSGNDPEAGEVTGTDEVSTNEGGGDDEAVSDTRLMESHIPVQLLTRLAAVLERHTKNPGRGFVGIWETWSGLSRRSVGSTVHIVEYPSKAAMLRALPILELHNLAQRIRSAYRPPGSGVLSREVAIGAKLELPGRRYFLFRSGITAFTRENWVDAAPWVAPSRNRLSLLRHCSRPVHTPALIWPEDRSWLLATDIDDSWGDDSFSLVGGSHDLIAELLATPGINAIPLHPDDMLYDDTD